MTLKNPEQSGFRENPFDFYPQSRSRTICDCARPALKTRVRAPNFIKLLVTKNCQDNR